MDVKNCAKCKIIKSKTEFEMRKNRPKKGGKQYLGLHPYCKVCLKKDKRACYVKRTYGITQEDYESLNTKQNKKCAICKRICITGKRLAIDHCHTTKKIRGLLCMRCNRAIGLFSDKASNLLNAYKYLTT